MARLAAANRVDDPLSYLSHLETPVESEAETTQIALGVLVKVEGVEGAAEAGFQIAEQDVDPAELRYFIGMTATSDDSCVAAACSHHERKQARPSESTQQLPDRCFLAQSASAPEVNPDTGEILAWMG